MASAVVPRGYVWPRVFAFTKGRRERMRVGGPSNIVLALLVASCGPGGSVGPPVLDGMDAHQVEGTIDSPSFDAGAIDSQAVGDSPVSSGPDSTKDDSRLEHSASGDAAGTDSPGADMAPVDSPSIDALRNDAASPDSVSAVDGTTDATAGDNPPDDLRVGDRIRPLNVEGTPLFSWYPHDSDGNQVQTAYQILVRLESSGATVWDSGKVASSDQAYIAYGGSALMAGESYTWTVRTWNRGDVASAWSAGAGFDTALSNNAQGWGASWIRRATTGTDAVDDYTLARVEKTIGAKPIRRARAYVSANHQFELHVNGAIVDRGPAFSYPGEGYYQATDLTRLIQAGAPLAVGVLYHWYGAGQGRPAGEPGLLVRIVVDHDDGTRELIVSDGSWRVSRASEWQTGAPQRNSDSCDYVEWIDMRQHPDGWDMPGFAGSGWVAPQVVGPHPSGVFKSVTGQEPRLRTTVVAPVVVKTLTDGTVVADFGNVIPARPTIRFASGVAGRTLNIVAGFHLTADGHVSVVPITATTPVSTSQDTDLSFKFIERAGAQEFRPMTFLGWRYLQISAPGEVLAPAAISAIVEHTDVAADRAATFESSDATLNSVFALVSRSALYAAQQQFLDTPTREKGQFLIDAVNESFATMMAWQEHDLTQQAIAEFVASQTRHWSAEGRLNAVYPNGDNVPKRDIPDFTEAFATWVWRYYTQTGDKTVLGRAYPALQKIADYIWSYRDGTTGLITNLAGGSEKYLYGIIDWPEVERRGYDAATTAHTSVNALAVEFFRATAATAGALSRPAPEIAAHTSRADQLTTSINASLRRSDGIYIDGSTGSTLSTHASQLANSYALAFGLVPAASRAAVADYIASMGMNQGPMTAHWLTKALADNERFDSLLTILTDRGRPGWANILSQGATFTWESWDAPVRGESESHGWGAQVVVDILESLLGVRVITPGAGTVGIRPPKTGLTFARGTVHTQRGPVAADWSRGLTGLTLKIDVPMNVQAQVALPAADVSATTATGAGAPHYRESGAGWVIYDVGSGVSTFTTH